MRRSATICLLTAAAALTGCQSEEKVWYRAANTGNGWLIARADFEAETCTLMYIAAEPPDEGESWVTGIHVFETLSGARPLINNPRDNPWRHAHVKWVRNAPVDVHLCTTNLDSLGESLGTEGSGAMSFGRIENNYDTDYSEYGVDYSDASLCSLRIDAEVGGVRFRENLQIHGSDGCDFPKKGPSHDIEAIQAHYSVGAEGPEGSVGTEGPEGSVGAEGPELVIAGEDREFELCVWQHFRMVEEPDDDVNLPPRWEFTGAGVGMRVNDESCDPATVRADFLENPYVSTLGLETEDRTPSLEFESSEVDVPCRIALDITHLSAQLYHWVPAKLRFEAKGIEVSGACDD